MSDELVDCLKTLAKQDRQLAEVVERITCVLAKAILELEDHAGFTASTRDQLRALAEEPQEVSNVN